MLIRIVKGLHPAMTELPWGPCTAGLGPCRAVLGPVSGCRGAHVGLSRGPCKAVLGPVSGGGVVVIVIDVSTISGSREWTNASREIGSSRRGRMRRSRTTMGEAAPHRPSTFSEKAEAEKRRGPHPFSPRGGREEGEGRAVEGVEGGE